MVETPASRGAHQKQNHVQSWIKQIQNWFG
jgi:hypothetical protein